MSSRFAFASEQQNHQQNAPAHYNNQNSRAKIAQAIANSFNMAHPGTNNHSPGRISGVRSTGIVKSWTKGFGFITRDDGHGDIFIHQTNIKTQGFRSLLIGEPVEFDIENKNDGRIQAINVTGPKGQSPIGSTHPTGPRGRGRGGGGGPPGPGGEYQQHGHPPGPPSGGRGNHGGGGGGHPMDYSSAGRGRETRGGNGFQQGGGGGGGGPGFQQGGGGRGAGGGNGGGFNNGPGNQQQPSQSYGLNSRTQPQAYSSYGYPQDPVFDTPWNNQSQQTSSQGGYGYPSCGTASILPTPKPNDGGYPNDSHSEGFNNQARNNNGWPDRNTGYGHKPNFQNGGMGRGEMNSGNNQRY